MVKEGVADILEEMKTEEKLDEEIKKRFTPQSAPEDPESKQKSRRSMYVIAGVFCIVLMLVFAFTLVRKDEVATFRDISGQSVKGVVDDRYRYNGFNFVNIDGIWYTELMNGNRKITLPLHYGPRDVENMTIDGSLGSGFTDAKLIYIAFDPLDNNLTYIALANGELSLSLARAMGLMLKAACTQNQTVSCAKQPILSCGSDDNKAIIELRQGNTTGVFYKNNCILVTGDDMNLVKAVDRLLLKWYGIMQ